MSDPLPLPALHASHGGCWLRDQHGATKGLGKGEAIMAAADTPLLMLGAPLVASRLGYPDLSGLDLLELFAFIHPARFMVPTPKGLAAVLGLEEPKERCGCPCPVAAGSGETARNCRTGPTGPNARGRGRRCNR